MLLPERGNRLVVFVDELDRCKPSYAVQLLERIKHYFSNDKVTVVFSINTKELQHSIRKFYGAEFDANKYLDRFFDYRISLPDADMDNYLALLSIICAAHISSPFHSPNGMESFDEQKLQILRWSNL